jgi:hypothetical protein
VRDIAEILEILDMTAWEGPARTNMVLPAVEALEDGRVLYCPRLGFELSMDERRFLTPDIADTKAKNVSFDPTTDTLKHARSNAADRDAIAAMMRRYAGCATTFVQTLVPQYAGAVQIGRTSFRPCEIRGRQLSPSKDDTRLHVDAFPSTPTGGKRILRVFTNVNPHGEGRHWRLGAAFEDVARTFLKSVPPRLPGSARVMNAIGATKSYRTPYDHAMLHIHDTMKADDCYQQRALQNEFSFPAGSTWMVYTDKVSHAAMGGQHLFEQTFYMPVRAMLDPAKAPLSILERLAGRALV